MDRDTRAIIIWRRLLEPGRYKWDWADPAACDSVSTEGAGWTARIWRPAFTPGSELLPAAAPGKFVEGCLRERLPHSLEIRVEGSGVVLLLRCDGDEPKIAMMMQGEWEAQIFNLPTYRSKNAGRMSALQSKRLGIALPV